MSFQKLSPLRIALAFLCFMAVRCHSQHTRLVVGDASSEGIFGLGWLWVEEPVIAATLNGHALAITSNSSMHAYFGGLNDANITAPVVVAEVTKSCVLLNPEEVSGKIVLVSPKYRYCESFQRRSAALRLLDLAGAKAVLFQEWNMPFEDPRVPSWRPITSTAIPLFVNVSIFDFLAETNYNATFKGDNFTITVLPADAEVKRWAANYVRSEGSVTIFMPIMYGILIIVTGVVAFLRVQKERAEPQGQVSRLLRLCLFMIIASCIERIIELTVDPKSKWGIFTDQTLSVIQAFGFSFDYSAVFLIISSWTLIVSFKPGIFSTTRVFKITLIFLIFIYVALTALETIEFSGTPVGAIAILALLLIVVVSFSITGLIFLRQLHISTKYAAKSHSENAMALRSLQIRMTVVLVGVVVTVLTLIVLFLIDISDSNWTAGHLVLPLVYELLRILILYLVVTALYVSPKREQKSSGSSHSSASAALVHNSHHIQRS